MSLRSLRDMPPVTSGPKVDFGITTHRQTIEEQFHDLLHMNELYGQNGKLEQMITTTREAENIPGPLLAKVIEEGAAVLYDHYLNEKVPALAPKMTMEAVEGLYKQENPRLDDDIINPEAGFFYDHELVRSSCHVVLKKMCRKDRKLILGHVHDWIISQRLRFHHQTSSYLVITHRKSFQNNVDRL